MESFMKGMHRGEKGFTLIEILIVIVLLGLLTAVVIPNISSFMTSGQLAAANSELEQVKTASLDYLGDNGVWPSSSDNLTGTYISGALKAAYYFDTGYGWVINATANPDGWTGIAFQQGVTGATGHHGKWTKP
jgi:prepilin-type N-terminal cleavage/methylation domain-containing protein